VAAKTNPSPAKRKKTSEKKRTGSASPAIKGKKPYPKRPPGALFRQKSEKNLH